MKKIYLRDFGIVANSNEDAVPAFKEAIKLNIDVELNKDVLMIISFKEFYAKIRYLSENNLDITKEEMLHEIFSMSSVNMKVKYGLDLQELIALYYKEIKTKKREKKEQYNE